MVTEVSGEWVADLVTMTCRNTANNIVIVFEKLEKTLIGKIKNIPLELVNKWAKEKQGDKNIINAIKEAEEIFLEAYHEKDKNGISEGIL
jgi:RNAse (barnase) inhibitor barstar